MRKGVIIFLIIVVVGFLMGFLLLKKNSPIVYLACRTSTSFGCHIDSCGSCKNSEQESGVYSEVLGKVCPIGIGYSDTRGYACRKTKKVCSLRQTLRVPFCQSLSDLNSKWRVKIGIENDGLFYYGNDSR